MFKSARPVFKAKLCSVSFLGPHSFSYISRPNTQFMQLLWESKQALTVAPNPGLTLAFCSALTSLLNGTEMST